MLYKPYFNADGQWQERIKILTHKQHVINEWTHFIVIIGGLLGGGTHFPIDFFGMHRVVILLFVDL